MLNPGIFLFLQSKINQFYQAWNLPQYLEAYHQQHSVRNPWNHIKTNGYHLFPLLVSSTFCLLVSDILVKEKKLTGEKQCVNPFKCRKCNKLKCNSLGQKWSHKSYTQNAINIAFVIPILSKNKLNCPKYSFLGHFTWIWQLSLKEADQENIISIVLRELKWKTWNHLSTVQFTSPLAFINHLWLRDSVKHKD